MYKEIQMISVPIRHFLISKNGERNRSRQPTSNPTACLLHGRIVCVLGTVFNMLKNSCKKIIVKSSRKVEKQIGNDIQLFFIIR